MNIHSKSLKIYCRFHGIQKFANIDQLLTYQTLNPVVAKFKRAHSIEKTDRRILTDQPNFCFVGNIKSCSTGGFTYSVVVHWQEAQLQGLQKTKITGQRHCNDLSRQQFMENQGRPKHSKNGSTYSTNEFSFACFTNKHLLIRCAVHCYLVSHHGKLRTIKFYPKYPMSKKHNCM